MRSMHHSPHATPGFLPLLGSLVGLAMAAPHAEGPGQSGGPPAGLSRPAEVTGESLVATELIPLTASIEAGKPFQVGIRYRIAPGWHIYWRNPGDSGSPPGVEWVLPEGFTAGPLEFPRPMVIDHPGDVTIGYEKECVLRATITPPAGKPLPAAIQMTARLDWLVCSTKCLMGRREAKASFAPTGRAVPTLTDEFPVALAQLGLEARLVTRPEGGSLLIRRAAAASAEHRPAKGISVRFLPDTTPGVTYGETAPQAVAVGGDDWSLSIPLTVKPQNALGQPLRAAGLVMLAGPDGRPAGCAEISLPLAAPAGSGT